MFDEAGAPFTLASYAVEGGGYKDYAKTKGLMYSQPAAWGELMGKLVTVQADYLRQQAKAGAAALQVFDSWAGLALGKDAYNKHVAPYNTKLFEMLKPTSLPVINFSTGIFPYLEDVAACGGDVIGGLPHAVGCCLGENWIRPCRAGQPRPDDAADPLG